MNRALCYALLIVSAALLLPSVARAQGLKQPVPANSEQENMVSEAVSLSDQQKYPESLEVLRKVLAANPDYVEALYETALTFKLNKEFDSSLTYAWRGTKYQSDLWTDFYLFLGKTYEDTNNWVGAASTYETAIAIDPTNYRMLHNLAFAKIRLFKYQESRELFEASLKQNADFASSWIYLGHVYYAFRQRVPTVLSFARALVLEPKISRSLERLEMMAGLMGWNVGVGSDSPLEVAFGMEYYGKFRAAGNIDYLARTQDDNLSEGDFRRAAVVLNRAFTGVGTGNRYPDNMTKFIAVWNRLITTLPDSNARLRGFATDYLVPYFKALKKEGHVEAFCYYIFSGADQQPVARWIHFHKPQVDAFLAWSKAYEFPSSK